MSADDPVAPLGIDRPGARADDAASIDRRAGARGINGFDSGAAFAAFASESEEEITRMNRLMKALRREGVSDTAPVVVAIRQLEQLAR